MRLLVLGGTRFVGRAVVADALARGWEVTALHRGVTGTLPPGVRPLVADRTSEPDLAAALDGAGGSGAAAGGPFGGGVTAGGAPGGGVTWDAVVDTWAGAPAVAALSARLLRGRVGRFGYVSSVSVYAWGTHVNESSPLVEGSPDAVDGDYAALKRGAELAVLASFPEAVLARAGLILGPHEDIGRLPWWLGRIARGGRVIAPGRPDRPLQYVDARDLAAWLLDAVAGDLVGPVDVISRAGHATTRSLLQACVDVTAPARPQAMPVELVWTPADVLAAAGAQPWTHLPCWVPETGEFAGFLESDTALARATGLVCRPVAETVADTWAWLQRDGWPEQRPDRPAHGLPPEIETALLSAG